MNKELQVINTVAFFGYSLSRVTDTEYSAAYETAKLIAQSGRRVANGGGPGVMYAATKGAKDGGGKVTVVYYEPNNATTFEGKEAINIADEHFEESNYVLRTKRLLDLGDAYIIFNGGTGTMSEFAMAWGVARLYLGHSKPLLLYGSFWKNIIEAFRVNTKVRQDAYDVYRIVTSPEEALSVIEEYDDMLQKHIRFHHQICTGEECRLFV